ncbi:MAG: transcription termination factor NusA [Candidatus Pacebacteria bacterium]|nr:transcription termination factor NusA [Candidatus Paceibacterota bacterium]MCD8508036.1 transcription termination factor NusA [Candidatus Paceibacterota bacterium]MCD8528325.1 transcription termination factor NusA [Candidatus Paceibacterota bacterium]MCD8563816.1 transcription termination factor NusA [Candidatus Paceibacterota bacterium]
MSLFDLKALATTLEQLEQEKRIPKERILDAIEQALAAAYKKDYGKKGQIIRCRFDHETGDTEFYQVKIVVDDSLVKPELTEEERLAYAEAKARGEVVEDEDAVDEDGRIRFNPEHHMYIDDAQKIKGDAVLEQEIIFPLEVQEDFGRIAAQTAKQVIIQRIREAEKESVLEEFEGRQDEIINGTVQKVERGNVFIDFGRATGIMPYDEQIPGEFYRTGQHIKALLYAIEETPRGVNLKLSRSHPRFIEELFALESPEIASGTVEIKSIAREPGSRSKMAVVSHDDNIDVIGACVGQKGIRVATVMGELSGEKIDIIPWSENPASFIASALAPATIVDIEINEDEHIAYVSVHDDKLSLAIGKGGQNVRLAAKLTGWKIDIKGVAQEIDNTYDDFETDTTDMADVEDVLAEVHDMVDEADDHLAEI